MCYSKILARNSENVAVLVVSPSVTEGGNSKVSTDTSSKCKHDCEEAMEMLEDHDGHSNIWKMPPLENTE